MKILLTIAWRNIWRNKGRSGALLAAIIIGLWAGVFTVGLMGGMLDQRINFMIESEITHLQIHHPDYRVERAVDMYIPNTSEIDEWLQGREEIYSFTKRILSDGMLQSPIKTSGVRIIGVDEETERKTTTFHENLREGSYLDTDIRNAILIGEKLANDHRLEIGQRLVLTFERTDGELSSGAFNIAGIFRTGSTQYDERNVVVRSSDLMSLLSSNEVYHEIAVLLKDVENSALIAGEINEKFDGIEAKTWNELSPELGTLVALGGLMLFLVTMIIMLALAFGILNTMLMALFERIREIGMLLSIGMSRLRVFSMFILEAIILTIVGAFFGILLAVLSINFFARNGINLEMFAGGIEEIGWPTVIYPEITVEEFTYIVIIVMLMTILASLYPAWKAFRVNPMEIEKDT